MKVRAKGAEFLDGGLTPDKIYIVTETYRTGNDTFYRLANDNGVVGSYFSWRFTIFEESKATEEPKMLRVRCLKTDTGALTTRGIYEAEKCVQNGCNAYWVKNERYSTCHYPTDLFEIVEESAEVTKSPALKETQERFENALKDIETLKKEAVDLRLAIAQLNARLKSINDATAGIGDCSCDTGERYV